MRSLFLTIAAALMLVLPLAARADLASVLAASGDQIAEPKRQRIGAVIAELVATGDPATARLLTAWEARNLGRRKFDGAFFILAETPRRLGADRSADRPPEPHRNPRSPNCAPMPAGAG